uniref:Polyprotein n=1 Tax=Guangdong greater green snake calicivirus TaxID=2116169 RepID=A0A2P1GMK3_9CALI|nr:polyprotein [Guangdong greater green snake calicivirus]
MKCHMGFQTRTKLSPLPPDGCQWELQAGSLWQKIASWIMGKIRQNYVDVSMKLMGGTFLKDFKPLNILNILANTKWSATSIIAAVTLLAELWGSFWGFSPMDFVTSHGTAIVEWIMGWRLQGPVDAAAHMLTLAAAVVMALVKLPGTQIANFVNSTLASFSGVSSAVTGYQKVLEMVRGVFNPGKINYDSLAEAVLLDCEPWIVDLDLILNRHTAGLISDPGAVQVFARQLDHVISSLSAVNTRDCKTPASDKVRRALTLAQGLRTQLNATLASMGRRVVPTVLMLTGPAGIGKTTLAYKLAQQLAMCQDGTVNAWNNDIDHHDNYTNSTAIVWEDFGKSELRKDLVTLQNLVDSTAYTLDCDRIENKGKTFTSPFIVITTNLTEPVPADYVNAGPALRRITALVDCVAPAITKHVTENPGIAIPKALYKHDCSHLLLARRGYLVVDQYGTTLDGSVSLPVHVTQGDLLKMLRESYKQKVNDFALQGKGLNTAKGVLIVGPPGTGKSVLARRNVGQGWILMDDVSYSSERWSAYKEALKAMETGGPRVLATANGDPYAERLHAEGTELARAIERKVKIFRTAWLKKGWLTYHDVRSVESGTPWDQCVVLEPPVEALSAALGQAREATVYGSDLTPSSPMPTHALVHLPSNVLGVPGFLRSLSNLGTDIAADLALFRPHLERLSAMGNSFAAADYINTSVINCVSGKVVSARHPSGTYLQVLLGPGPARAQVTATPPAEALVSSASAFTLAYGGLFKALLPAWVKTVFDALDMLIKTAMSAAVVYDRVLPKAETRDPSLQAKWTSSRSMVLSDEQYDDYQDKKKRGLVKNVKDYWQNMNGPIVDLGWEPNAVADWLGSEEINYGETIKWDLESGVMAKIAANIRVLEVSGSRVGYGIVVRSGLMLANRHVLATSPTIEGTPISGAKCIGSATSDVVYVSHPDIRGNDISGLVVTDSYPIKGSDVLLLATNHIPMKSCGPDTRVVDGSHLTGIICKTTMSNSATSYFCPTSPGDCGAPYVCMKGGSPKVFGLHSAGSSTSGSVFCSTIPVQNGMNLQGKFSGHPIVGQCEHSLTENGSAYGPSLSAAFLPVELNTHCPALVGRCDSRVSAPPSAVKLLRDQLAHYPVDGQRTDIARLKDQFVEYLRGYVEPGMLTFDQAFSSLDPETSTGWPFFQRKRDMLGDANELVAGTPLHTHLTKHYGLWKAGKLDGGLFTASLKDELVPKEKVYDVAKQKKRLLWCAPVHLSLVMASALGGVLTQLKQHVNELPIKVGINAHVDWTILARQLASKDYVVDLDYSRWDSSVPRDALVCALEVLLSLSGCPDVMANEITKIFRRPVQLLVGDQVVEVATGLPSGTPATSQLNSLVHWMAVVSIVNKKTGLSLVEIMDHMNMACYGDDGVYAFDKVLAKCFSVSDLVLGMQQYGFKPTSPDKVSAISARPLHELTFLKRGFVRHGDRWLAPLELSSLIRQLYWVRGSTSRDTTKVREAHDQRGVQLMVVVLEASMHKPKDYQVIAELVRQVSKIECLDISVPDQRAAYGMLQRAVIMVEESRKISSGFVNTDSNNSVLACDPLYEWIMQSKVMRAVQKDKANSSNSRSPQYRQEWSLQMMQPGQCFPPLPCRQPQNRQSMNLLEDSMLLIQKSTVALCRHLLPLLSCSPTKGKEPCCGNLLLDLNSTPSCPISPGCTILGPAIWKSRSSLQPQHSLPANLLLQCSPLESSPRVSLLTPLPDIHMPSLTLGTQTLSPCCSLTSVTSSIICKANQTSHPRSLCSSSLHSGPQETRHLVSLGESYRDPRLGLILPSLRPQGCLTSLQEQIFQCCRNLCSVLTSHRPGRSMWEMFRSVQPVFNDCHDIMGVLPPLVSCGGGTRDNLVQPATYKLPAMVETSLVCSATPMANHGRQEFLEDLYHHRYPSLEQHLMCQLGELIQLVHCGICHDSSHLQSVLTDLLLVAHTRVVSGPPHLWLSLHGTLVPVFHPGPRLNRHSMRATYLLITLPFLFLVNLLLASVRSHIQPLVTPISSAHRLPKWRSNSPLDLSRYRKALLSYSTWLTELTDRLLPSANCGLLVSLPQHHMARKRSQTLGQTLTLCTSRQCRSATPLMGLPTLADEDKILYDLLLTHDGGCFGDSGWERTLWAAAGDLRHWLDGDASQGVEGGGSHYSPSHAVQCGCDKSHTIALSLFPRQGSTGHVLVESGSPAAIVRTGWVAD